MTARAAASACAGNANDVLAGQLSTADLYGNPPVITVNGVTGYQWKPFDSLADDDRDMDYTLYQIGAGYQLTDEIYGTITFEHYDVDLKDGNTAFQAYQLHEMASGEHTKDKMILQARYNIGGAEIGFNYEYNTGDFTPDFGGGFVTQFADAGVGTTFAWCRGLAGFQRPLRRLEPAADARLRPPAAQGVPEALLLGLLLCEGIRSGPGKAHLDATDNHTIRRALDGRSASCAGPPALRRAGRQENLIFELEGCARGRPRRRPHGLPAARDFERGDLDLIRSALAGESERHRLRGHVRQADTDPRRVTVDDLGTQLDTLARHGFYTFNIDIYIDTDRGQDVGRGGHDARPQAEVRVEDAWDRAIVVTPQPNEARGALTRQVVRTLEPGGALRTNRPVSLFEADEARSVPADMDERVFFPDSDPGRGQHSQLLRAELVPRRPGAERVELRRRGLGCRPDPAHDISARAGLAEATRDNLMVLPVSPGSWQNRFGGGREGQDLQPPLIDIMVPQGSSQETILGDFSSRNERPVRLPGVVPAEESGS